MDGAPHSPIADGKRGPLELLAWLECTRAHLVPSAAWSDPNLIPKPVLGLDVRRLPLGPVEAFVLSRVDGRTTDSDIALQVGISASEVVLVLHRLAELGAIAYDGSGNAPRQAEQSRTTNPIPSTGSGLHRRADPVITDAPVAESSPIEYPELAEEVDLDLDRKRLVLDTFASLGKTDHYGILKIPKDADKKRVKSAYFQVVANFHPDRYFGKKLGGYKPKLEAIFRRLTEAHDTLTKKETREEYDRYLESQQATKALDDLVDNDAHSKQLHEVEREIEREAGLGTGSSAPSLTPRPSLSPEERRRALARKFSSPAIAAPRRPSGPSPSDGASREAQQSARQALQNRYESKLAAARADRIRRLVEQADHSLASKNLPSAANALRLAVSLSPDDAALAARFATVERDASASLAERYLEQAHYDEQRGRWAEAAQAYERALRGRPTAQVHERTAHCLVEARMELKKAVDLARKAVELSPQTTSYRITLARAFARAGKAQSALAELERARTQDPRNDTVKDWIARVKRGEA